MWAPLNFLVYLALTGTQLEDVRHDLAQKSAKLFMKEWKEHRQVLSLGRTFVRDSYG